MPPMDTSAIRTATLARTYPRPKKRWANPDPPQPATFPPTLPPLLAPTSGRAWVDGHDVVTEADAIRPKINIVSGGESSGYGILTVRENLWLFARIYGVANAEVKTRIERMLGVVSLTDKGN